MDMLPDKPGVTSMLQEIAGNWWVLLIRGIAAILLGIFAFTWPGITLAILVIMFGIYALLDGVSAIGFGFANYRTDNSWWEMGLIGLLGILAGIITLIWPGITLIALLVVIGVWAIIRGVVEIFAAIRLRKMIAHEWLLILAGVLSMVFGAIVLLRPWMGAMAIVWLTGVWAILFGITAIALSVRLNRVKHRLEAGPTSSPMPPSSYSA